MISGNPMFCLESDRRSLYNFRIPQNTEFFATDLYFRSERNSRNYLKNTYRCPRNKSSFCYEFPRLRSELFGNL
ncbi:hypothetical protein LEP1GSC161_0466 [Leptospira santarosai str. CBC1416]|uniref:Uncharacterized protein n=4 Tax=Leptospira santarosai TaxID=28183 RepID=M6VJE9_9LEPT|nr:hypothetical protein LEP1GSC161_0466 [Leptospira santarosai str. CBC1416]